MKIHKMYIFPFKVHFRFSLKLIYVWKVVFVVPNRDKMNLYRIFCRNKLYILFYEILHRNLLYKTMFLYYYIRIGFCSERTFNKPLNFKVITRIFYVIIWCFLSHFKFLKCPERVIQNLQGKQIIKPTNVISAIINPTLENWLIFKNKVLM